MDSLLAPGRRLSHGEANVVVSMLYEVRRLTDESGLGTLCGACGIPALLSSLLASMRADSSPALWAGAAIWSLLSRLDAAQDQVGWLQAVAGLPLLQQLQSGLDSLPLSETLTEFGTPVSVLSQGLLLPNGLRAVAMETLTGWRLQMAVSAHRRASPSSEVP